MEPNLAATPEIVVRDGKPVAVILNIDEYRALLGKAEDLEALKALESMRRELMEFRRLDDFQRELGTQSLRSSPKNS